MRKEHERFRLIDGGGRKPKRRKKESAPLVCHRCGGTAFYEVRLNPQTDGARTWGGTRQLRCDGCGEPYSAA